MTLTNPNAYLSDTSQWVHSTFMVSMSESYTTYEEMLKHVLTDEQNGTVVSPQMTSANKEMLSKIAKSQGTDDGSSMMPYFYSLRRCRDTSLGGNDAINPYWQYCENDDIAHPFHISDKDSTVKMGRVYSETIDENQRILYLGFGTPKFNNLAGFYSKAYDTDMGHLVNNGPAGINVMELIGELCGAVANVIIRIPQIPFTILRYMFYGADRSPVTKYYDFKSQMALYYRFVNTILIQLGTNLGIVDTASYQSKGSDGNTTTGSVISSKTYSELFSSANQEMGAKNSLPDYVKDYNFDMFRIVLKQATIEGLGNIDPDKMSTDQALIAQGQASDLTNTDTVSGDGLLPYEDSDLCAFWAAYKGSIHQAFLFVGFKVEKGMSASESLSTSTGQSPVQQTINSKLQSARNMVFATMGGNVSDGWLGKVLGTVGSLAASAAEGFASGFNLAGLSALATGSAMIDIPEVWQDSTFSKSYSFNLQLRAPYGDPYSIMQSLYVPLACVLAGALPRGTGASSYTSPFLCRAYCKGLFSVPLGIIDSVSINRGGDTHGWNHMGLPLALDLSISIKDLSPSMIVALAGSSLKDAVTELIGADTPFNQYLMTLSGVGPLEWLNPVNAFKRRAKILHATLTEEITNPIQIAMSLGQRSPARMYYNFYPETQQLPR